VSLTQVLAILGAVTGTSGAILGVMSFRRDRARLIVRPQLVWGDTFVGKVLEASEDEVFDLYLFVINAGRQPVAIISVGVTPPAFGGWPTERRRRVRPSIAEAQIRARRGASGVALSPVDDEPVVLEPGEMKKYVMRGTVANRGPDKYLAFAIDALDRVTVGRLDLWGAAEFTLVRDAS
jgi:hypothetical protein